MSLALRLFGSKASSGGVWGTSASWIVNGGGVGARKTSSGETVTQESALALGAYYGCLTGIAADVAGVPASVVESLLPRGRSPLADHPVTRIMHEEFNPELDAFVGRETLTAWALGWGKGMAEITRDARGNARELWPIHPSRIRLMRGDGVDGRTKGVLGWGVRASDIIGREVWIPDRDMFHIHGCGDGVEGVPILRAGAEAIGLGLAAQTTAGAILGNGLAPSATFSLTQALGEQELKAFHERMAEQSGAMKSGGILILNGEGKLERWTINPEEAQLLEARGFQVEEVCRFFRRSPRKVGHKSSAQGWSTLDAEQVDDINDCLMPWWIRWEREAKRKLIGAAPRLSLKHYVQGRMRGDAKTRSEYLRARVNMGTMTPNEVREIEDEDPSDEENADRLIVQGATVLLDALTDDPIPPPTPPGKGAAAPVDTQPDPEDPAGDPPDPAEATDPPADAPALADAAAAAAPPVVPVTAAAPAPATGGIAKDITLRVGERVDPCRLPAAAPALSLAPIFLDAARRVVTKEVAALDRAMKKHAADAGAFGTWAADFYATQRTYVADAFNAVALVAAGSEGSARLGLFASGLWSDPVARTGEACREKPEALASALASRVEAAVRGPKE